MLHVMKTNTPALQPLLSAYLNSTRAYPNHNFVTPTILKGSILFMIFLHVIFVLLLTEVELIGTCLDNIDLSSLNISKLGRISATDIVLTTASTT